MTPTQMFIASVALIVSTAITVVLLMRYGKREEDKKKEKIYQAIREIKDQLPSNEDLKEIYDSIERIDRRIPLGDVAEVDSEECAERFLVLSVKYQEIEEKQFKMLFKFERTGVAPEGVEIANLRISAVKLKTEMEKIKKELDAFA